MPALPPVPDVLKMVMHFTVGADTNALCVLHYEYSGGPPSGGDCNTFAADAVTAFTAHMAALMNPGNTLTSVQIQDLNSSTGAQGSSTTASVGTRTGATTTANVASLFNHQIARRYRGGKPRSYFPFGNNGDLQTQQSWGASFISAANSGFAAWNSAFVGSTSTSTTISAHVNVSYYSGFTNVSYGSPTKYRRVPTLRVGGPVIDVITNSTINSRVGSIRRRIGR